MRSTVASIFVGLIIIGGIGFGGFFIVKKMRASADVETIPTVTSGQTADITKDGKVDALDLNALTNAMSTQSTEAKYDLNKDGKVDALDLNVLINQYKK